MKLDHIVLLVSDIAESLRFYECLLPMLGFRKTAEHVFGNDDEIYLDIRPARDTAHGYERFAPGLNHLGFTAPGRDAIANIQSRMRTAGFEVPELQSFDDGVAIFFRDPDGMRIELGVYDAEASDQPA